ncbi:MAG: trigger factor [Hyphomicrobiaceae bacterium]
MQVTETSSEGLKRALSVVLPATDLKARVDRRIDEMKDRVQLKGFRKGKVPPAHLRKVFGRSLMAEVLQEAVEETTKQALETRNERPAMQPKVDLVDDSKIDKVIAGESDLAFTMEYEILPKFEVADLAALQLERLVAEVPGERIEEALTEIATRNRDYATVEDRAADDGDRLTISFVGRIDGEAFDGGTAEDVDLVIGENRFIPGFEDGLRGGKAGETRMVNVTFPDDYSEESLKGKPAEFETSIKSVAVAAPISIDDALAQKLGLESLDQLRGAVRGQIQGEYDRVSRDKLKRQLLDRLDEAHTFELPPSLVDEEFQGLWNQMTKSLERAGKTLEEEGKTEEGAREEFRKLAERRVRLGLVIGEIGDTGKIEVTEDELRRALIEQSRQFPGQERMVYEYYEKTPGAIAQLRAPIFEEKVVDYILSLAKPVDKSVSVEELLKPLDDEEPGGDAASA